MSRIGKLPITLPQTVQVSATDTAVAVKGPKGELSVQLPEHVTVTIEDGKLLVVSTRSNLQGLVKTHISNAVKGVTDGWTKSLELSGTGYRAAVAGSNLQLALGFSHPVVIAAPEGISFVVKENLITVQGANRSMVGQVAAIIRAKKPADPYKAKGLKYEKEVIVRKAGKAAKAGGGK